MCFVAKPTNTYMFGKGAQASLTAFAFSFVLAFFSRFSPFPRLTLGVVGVSPAPCTYVNKYEGTYLWYKSLVCLSYLRLHIYLGGYDLAKVLRQLGDISDSQKALRQDKRLPEKQRGRRKNPRPRYQIPRPSFPPRHPRILFRQRNHP